MYKEGKCSCGEVEFYLKEKPLFVQACHCSLCQRTTGSAFNIISVIESKNVVIEKGKNDITTFEFKGGSRCLYDIYTCKNCGTGLWGKPRVSLKEILYVRSGTLLDAQDIKPLAHIFVQNKVDWLTLPTDVPHFECMYDMEKTWPKESLKRFTEI